MLARCWSRPMRPRLAHGQPSVYTSTMTTSTSLDRAVDRLEHAVASGIACPPVRDLVGCDDIAAAYRVKSGLIARRLRRGAARAGRKIGLTNPVVQRQLGVGQPDFGVLLDDMAVPDGGVVPTGRL